MAVLASFAAVAGNAPVMQADIYTTYDNYESVPGESLDNFMLRVAPALAMITNASGFEVCAVVAQSQAKDRWGVTLTSSQSQMACVIRNEIVPDGMVATNISIHTHPDNTSHRRAPTTMDIQLSQALGRDVVSNSEDARRDFGKLARPGGFSPQDMETGPGHLVTANRLLFQNGARKTRAVGTFRR